MICISFPGDKHNYSNNDKLPTQQEIEEENMKNMKLKQEEIRHLMNENSELYDLSPKQMQSFIDASRFFQTRRMSQSDYMGNSKQFLMKKPKSDSSKNELPPLMVTGHSSFIVNSKTLANNNLNLRTVSRSETTHPISKLGVGFKQPLKKPNLANINMRRASLIPSIKA